MQNISDRMRPVTQGRSFKNEGKENYHPLQRGQIWQILKIAEEKLTNKSFVLSSGRKTAEAGWTKK